MVDTTSATELSATTNTTADPVEVAEQINDLAVAIQDLQRVVAQHTENWQALIDYLEGQDALYTTLRNAVNRMSVEELREA